MMMNPWILHLQKLDLELKCPICLKLLNQPVLLPCDHVFCDSCIHESSQIESGCPVYKSKHSKNGMKASLESTQLVDEEPYEIHIDTQGCQDAPKTARLVTTSSKPKLFDALKFYFYGDYFFKGYKEELQNLVKVAGDTILKTEDELSAESSNNVNDQRSSTIMVYNIDPPAGCGLGEEVTIIWQRANEAEALSSKTVSRVIGHT